MCNVHGAKCKKKKNTKHKTRLLQSQPGGDNSPNAIFHVYTQCTVSSHHVKRVTKQEGGLVGLGRSTPMRNNGKTGILLV